MKLKAKIEGLKRIFSFIVIYLCCNFGGVWCHGVPKSHLALSHDTIHNGFVFHVGSSRWYTCRSINVSDMRWKWREYRIL